MLCFNLKLPLGFVQIDGRVEKERNEGKVSEKWEENL